MPKIQTENQLEELLATPNQNDIELMKRLDGDIILLGAGGKMGPSLARRIKRAVDASDRPRKVIAVSRFSSPIARNELDRAGIITLSVDLLNRDEVDQLPLCENVFFMVGRKFGSTDRSDLTWASNTITPTYVAHRYRDSRIVAFSSGNVYPFVNRTTGGCKETDMAEPRGDYANSALGREKVFEYFSHEHKTPCLIYRLNYAVDLRYGVLVDIGRKVFAGQPVSVNVGYFNVIWQGDANSYAMRSLELCASPAKKLNVTGLEINSVRQAAEFFGNYFQRQVMFEGVESGEALLNDASQCMKLLGKPEISYDQLIEMVAYWIKSGGMMLDKPTKFEVTDGKF